MNDYRHMPEILDRKNCALHRHNVPCAARRAGIVFVCLLTLAALPQTAASHENASFKQETVHQPDTGDVLISAHVLALTPPID